MAALKIFKQIKYTKFKNIRGKAAHPKAQGGFVPACTNRTYGGLTSEFSSQLNCINNLHCIHSYFHSDTSFQNIQDEIPQCMLLANDTIIDKTQEGINPQFELRKQTLEIRQFRLIRFKIKYTRVQIQLMADQRLQYCATEQIRDTNK